MTIEISSVVRQSEQQVAAEVDGEVVMMSIESGNYYGLDEVGSRIWALLETPTTVTRVCDTLMDEFEVERTTLEGHVLQFLKQLAEQGLIRIEGTTAP